MFRTGIGKMQKKITGAIFSLLFLLSFALATAQQVPPYLGPISGTLVTSTSVKITSLTGQSICSTIISGSGSFTGTFLTANDNSTYVASYTVNAGTLAQITTASSNGRFLTFIGSAKNFEFLPGTITGTVNYSITCSTANVPISGAGAGGATPIPFPTFPWSVVFPASYQTAFPTPQPNATNLPYFVSCVIVAPGVCPTPVPLPVSTAPGVETTPAVSTTPAAILGAGASTSGYIICNPNNFVVYIAHGVTVSTTQYSSYFPSAPSACLFSDGPYRYQGVIWAVGISTGVMDVFTW